MIPAATTKLKAGDRVRVHGFIMLKGLDAGNYRVAYQYNHVTYGPVYSFARPRGRRILCSFPACKIDPWLNKGVSEFNYIEVL